LLGYDIEAAGGSKGLNLILFLDFLLDMITLANYELSALLSLRMVVIEFPLELGKVDVKGFLWISCSKLDAKSTNAFLPLLSSLQLP
jgi:hypothetical protein